MSRSNINRFRADLLDKTEDGKYVVPCGMNTIKRLGDKPFSVGKLLEELHPLPANKVLVISVWIDGIQDYAVSQVLHSDSGK